MEALPDRAQGQEHRFQKRSPLLEAMQSSIPQGAHRSAQPEGSHDALASRLFKRAQWRLDRLARSLGQLIETVETLERRGVGFRSLTESIDTTSAGGRLVFHLFGAMAEFERGLVRERTRAGLAAARARGRVGGRPAALNAKDLAAARALLRDPAITVEAVARRLGVAPSTLYRHLPGGRSGLEP